MKIKLRSLKLLIEDNLNGVPTRSKAARGMPGVYSGYAANLMYDIVSFHEDGMKYYNVADYADSVGGSIQGTAAWYRHSKNQDEFEELLYGEYADKNVSMWTKIDNENKEFKNDPMHDEFAETAKTYQEDVLNMLHDLCEDLSDEQLEQFKDFYEQESEGKDPFYVVNSLSLAEWLDVLTSLHDNITTEDILALIEEGEEALREYAEYFKNAYGKIDDTPSISPGWQIRVLVGNSGNYPDIQLMKGNSKIQTSTGKIVNFGTVKLKIVDAAKGMSGYMGSDGAPGLSIKLEDENGNIYYYYNRDKTKSAKLEARSEMDPGLLSRLERYYR